MTSPAKRPLHLPLADFSSLEIPKTRKGFRKWWRLHQGSLSPIFYSKSDANRFAVPALGTLYVGSDPQTCLLEKYGDELYGAKNRGEIPRLSATDWRDRAMTAVGIPAVYVCDLTSPETLSACRVDMGTLTHPDLIYPQAWAKAIMEHPANFDGILYLSRFTQKPCLALYPRREIEVRIINSDALAHHPDGMKLLDEFQVALV
jgi:hypothetical protein